MVSVLFSVEDYEESLNSVEKVQFDEFFSQLQLDKTNVRVDKINFNEPLRKLRWGSRYGYKGSLT